MSKAKVKRADIKDKSELIWYRTFFANCVGKKMVKTWQEEEIRVFFKDLGLTEKEPEDVYIRALAKY